MDIDKWDLRHHIYTKYFLDGALAGTFAQAVSYPLNSLAIPKVEGLQFWKSYFRSCVILFPATGLKFCTFEVMRENKASNFISGATGGAIMQIFKAPFEVRSNYELLGFKKTNLQIIISKGLLPVISEQLPFISRAAIFEGIVFSCYHFLKDRFSNQPTMITIPLSGGASFVIAQTIVQPLHLVQNPNIWHKRISISERLWKVIKNDGFFSLWRKLPRQLFPAFLFGAVQFFGYEQLKSLLSL